MTQGFNNAADSSHHPGSAADMQHIEDVLQRDGLFVGTTAGVSMWPMLRNRRDTIVVRPPVGRLSRYDVALYRRGDDYVLHRVVQVQSTAYTICGDNCLELERGITDDQVIGVLTGFYRGNREVNMQGLPYRAYEHLWVGLYPLRRAWKRARSCAGRVLRGAARERVR